MGMLSSTLSNISSIPQPCHTRKVGLFKMVGKKSLVLSRTPETVKRIFVTLVVRAVRIKIDAGKSNGSGDNIQASLMTGHETATAYIIEHDKHTKGPENMVGRRHHGLPRTLARAWTAGVRSFGLLSSIPCCFDCRHVCFTRGPIVAHQLC